MNRTNGTRLFLIIFFVLIGSHVLLIGTRRIYPFTDLPNHLAAATINRYYDDPSNQFSEFYSRELFLKPNIFHLLFCSFPLFPSVESANRFLLCLYALLLPLSVLLLVRRLGGNRWFALLSFLLLYNYNVSWGFVGFSLAIPVVLLFLYESTGFLESPRAWNGLASAALCTLLFFIHALAAIFSIVLLLVCLIRHRRDGPAGLMTKGVIVLPPAVLLALWWSAESSHRTTPGIAAFLGNYYAHAYIPSLIKRYSALCFDNYHLLEGRVGVAACVFFTLCIIVPAIVTMVLLRGGASAGTADSWPASALFTMSLACFLILPRDLPAQAILYQRFSSLLLLSAVVLGACRIERRPHGIVSSLRTLGAVGICAVCFLHLALWADHLTSFDRENRSFTADIFPQARAGSVLCGFIRDYRYRGRPAYIHFPSYYIVWRRGIACTKVIDYRFGTVRRKARARALPPYHEWAGKFDSFDGRYGNVDYLLLRGRPTERALQHLETFRPVAYAGRWTLFENTEQTIR